LAAVSRLRGDASMERRGDGNRTGARRVTIASRMQKTIMRFLRSAS
jgi:hypothetical protein